MRSVVDVVVQLQVSCGLRVVHLQAFSLYEG